MNKNSKIYIAGHRGLVGSALLRRLQARGYTNIVTRTHAELELTGQARVREFFGKEQPEYVFLAAAKVGGIQANLAQPAEFIHTNLAIQTSVIDAAHVTGVKRLIFFGSNCTYPRECPQPMREEYLLTGPLEPSSEVYAVAKISGMKMCDAYNRQYGTCFLSVIPATLYGPNDNFDSETSHVLSALLARFHRAREANEGEAIIWGSGRPRREFLYVDDLADACIFLATLDEAELRTAIEDCGWVLNCGSREDLAISELASLIKRAVGFQGEIQTDLSRPDGAARKLLDSSKIARLGWSPRVSLTDGIAMTYSWYRSRDAEEVGQRTGTLVN